MSYISSSPRGYEQAHQDLPQNSHPQSHQSRLPMVSTAFTDAYPSHQQISTSPSPPSAYVPDLSLITLPKVGQTRCYWALLSSDLQFIYLDPVLAAHLERQAALLVGKSLLSFVHPDEQATAKQDLGSVLESRTLHGSVTRVRFSRLSKVRRQLGNEGPSAPWADADKIALDQNYMAVDIVINWAAEGLVLCFIHASVDLTPNDNDEHQKTDWTNWCGTPMMSVDQLQLLFRRLFLFIPQPGSMDRVFQILANQPSRPLLFSWPPDQEQTSEPTSRDFARLVENMDIRTGIQGANDAKTSCTRRYKALQDIPIFGGEVESIFIPHGSVIFACHKVNPNSRSVNNSTATMHQLGYHSAGYSVQQNPTYYEQGGSYSLPPLSSQDASFNGSYISPQGQGVQTSYSPQRWSQTLPPTVSNLRSNSYPPPTSQDNTSWQPGSPTAYLDPGNPSQPPPFRSISPGYSYSPTAGSSAGASPTSDVVPPPRRRVSPGSTRDQYGPGSRNTGNRPIGVLKCSSCKATSSPEWRKGPSGKKELCNACGLRYARSRAKKEGQTQTQRRRKDKGLIKRESATPPVSVSPSYTALRQGYGDGSFSASSAGSASGSDIYPHPGQRMLQNMTPSPSPPASNMNFVHYSPAGDNRATYNTANAFYSMSSPLSNPPVSQQTESLSHPHHHMNQLPPLGQISAYADRLSPMVPSMSPISHSSLTSILPTNSYERERDRDRDLRDMPPTPLSAESRHSRRSILTHQ